jgi:hypothetical protein
MAKKNQTAEDQQGEQQETVTVDKRDTLSLDIPNNRAVLTDGSVVTDIFGPPARAAPEAPGEGPHEATQPAANPKGNSGEPKQDGPVKAAEGPKVKIGKGGYRPPKDAGPLETYLSAVRYAYFRTPVGDARKPDAMKALFLEAASVLPAESVAAVREWMTGVAAEMTAAA